MSRPRKSQIDCSLFPFLSVLCSLIGVFSLFLILVIGSRSLDQSKGAEAADRTVASSATTGISDDEFRTYLGRVESLEREVAARRRQRADLLARVEELEELLNSKSKEIAATGKGKKVGVLLGKPDDVEMTVVPGLSIKQPKFIEVDRQGFIAHPEQTKFPHEQLQDPKSPLNNFINQMDGVREHEYLLFLVRPEGIAVFNEMRSYLLKNYPGQGNLSRIDIGWEPFSDAWMLLSKQQKP